MPTSDAALTRTEIERWAHTLYADHVDHKDAAAFAAVFTDDATLRFGNAEPLHGRAAIEEAIAHFFTAFVSLRHVMERVSIDGDAVFLQARVTYTRHDGHVVSVPAMTVFDMGDEDDAAGRRLARRCEIYVDLAPLFGPAPAPAG